jgi:hypothetical protein
MKTSIPKQAIEDVEFVPEGAGEAGWFIYLKPGWSFDPGSEDTTRFIPLDNAHEGMMLMAYKLDDSERLAWGVKYETSVKSGA